MNEFQELKNEIAQICNLNNALALIYWDMQTKMPREAIVQRSEVIELLSGQIFSLQTSDKMGELLCALEEKSKGFSDEDKAIISIAKKDYETTKKIPEDRYKEFVVASALSSGAWQEAKEKKDFDIFKPHLKAMIDFKREFAEYMGYKDSKYDALLAQFEEGLTVKKLDKTFGELKVATMELLNKVLASKVNIDNSFLMGTFNNESQKKIAIHILDKMGYDFNRGRLDESLHPFTTGFGNKDVRITTNLSVPDFNFCLYSCIHEGGHGIYEQDIPDSLQNTGLDKALSMSIHESQSRFYENFVGRSREFWNHFLSYVQYEFPEFKNKSVDDFYKAVNIVKPDLIRTAADELTYNLHIIIRYEIEKELIEGKLDIDSVRDAWNAKYHEYLGVTPNDDSEGILQDMHWSDGSFGYFPSYALGNIYGAQMLNKLKQDNSDVYEKISNGELSVVHEWLKDNVHKYGAIYNPADLIMKITGEELNVKYFIDYLNEKYSKLYDLK